MNNRWERLVAGIFMPGAIGTILLFVFMLFIRQPQDISPLYFMSFVGMLIFAYLYAGIQSVIYSIAMEFVVNPRVESNFIAVGVSGILGALSGVFIWGWFIAVIGLLSGLVSGLYIRNSYIKEKENNKKFNTDKYSSPHSL